MPAAVPSLLRPSSALRWVNCPGSHALEALYPEDEDSPEAREGTAAHFYATEYLSGRVWPVGTLAPNGWPIDAEMIAGAQHLIDDVLREWPTFAPGSQFGVEHRIFCHGLIHPLNEGTPDVFAASLAQRRVILWDYKYGHRYVDPFQFWQGINYVGGIFEANELTAADVADWSVSIRVVQPRNYHPSGVVRVWNTTGAYIWALLEYMSRAADLAVMPDAPTRTGDHCRDCNGRHACPAFAQVAAAAMDTGGQNTPWELPLDALGRELSRLHTARARIDARIDGLAEVALAAIRAGKRVDGWGMGFVDSRERWSQPDDAVYAMGDLLGVDLRANAPVTPAQAKAKLKAAGLDPAVMVGFYSKPTGAAKLRPADPNAAAKAFT